MFVKGRASTRGSQPITSRILAMKFAGEFMLIYPLYPIMFSERGGVSAAGVGIILATTSALGFLFEVPTGILADKISRKYVLLASLFFKALCLVLWLAVPSFLGYWLGAVSLAISAALESGAIQAYLYGTLSHDGKQQFGKFWSRVSAMVMLSWSLAYVATTVIGIHYGVILGLSILACLVGIVICLTLPKDNVAASNTEVKPKVFRSAITNIKHSPELKSLLVVGILVIGIAFMTVVYIGPYYHQSGVSTRWVPLLMAAGNILGATMFWTLHSWEHILDRYILLLATAVGALFILSFFGGVVAVCLGFLLVARFFRILQVQFESKVQHLANEEARATTSSILNFGASILQSSLEALVGLFAIANVVVQPLRGFLLGGLTLYILLYIITRRQLKLKRLAST